MLVHAMSASLRFDGALNVDVSGLQTFWVLYPRTSFMLIHARNFSVEKTYIEQLLVTVSNF